MTHRQYEYFRMIEHVNALRDFIELTMDDYEEERYTDLRYDSLDDIRYYLNMYRDDLFKQIQKEDEGQ